jgi:tetratricopeptide (TPR) repeat protein
VEFNTFAHSENKSDKYLRQDSVGPIPRKNKNEKKSFNPAEELDVEFAKAYYKRGNVKRMLNDFQGAIEDYSRAIEINPSLAEAHNNRGLCRLKLGDIDGGQVDFLKAAELGYYKARDILKEYCR